MSSSPRAPFSKPAVPPRSLAVVLPCRNEEGNVERVVGEMLTLAGPLAARVEIVIVNDGSTDATGAIADRVAAADSRVLVVHNAIGRGYGGALRAGFAATTADWLFYTDGDGQIDCSPLRAAVGMLGEVDAVAGYRMNRTEGWSRRFNGWAWTRLVNAVFAYRFRDVDCAFKLIPGAWLRGLPLASTGAMVSAELLAYAARELRVREIAVGHRPRTAGRPTGANPRVILRAFRELFALAGRIRRG